MMSLTLILIVCATNYELIIFYATTRHLRALVYVGADNISSTPNINSSPDVSNMFSSSVIIPSLSHGTEVM